jgi:hypothetical protein
MVVNFEFLGNEAIENVITCMNFKIDKVVFFGYEETIQEQNHNAKNFLKKYCGVQEIVFCALKHNNLDSVLHVMKENIEKELNQKNQIFFDITGGESLLLVAFGMLAKEFELPMHQYDIYNNKLIELNENNNHSISKNVQQQHIKLNLDRFIEMRGGSIDYNLAKDIKGDMNQEFIEDVSKIWDVAKNNEDYWNPFSEFLRKNLVPDKNLEVNYSESFVLKALSLSKTKLNNIKTLNKLIDKLADVGVLVNVVHTNGKYRFSFKNEEIKNCIWEGGSVLELYVYQNMKKQSDDCMVGVHLDWDGIIHSQLGEDVLNEVDVLALSGNVPTFISCKSGKMESKQTLHALYELQTVTDRFGGKYAKKILVTLKPLAEVYMERAAEMEIEVKIINKI